MNAEALRDGGLIIADEGEFTARNLAKAGYEQPARGRQPRWQVVHFNISQLTLDAVKPFGLGNKEALRCKNMWTLGLALWMFDRDRAADRRLAQDQVRQGARARRSQHRGAQRRPRLWRNGGNGRAVQAARYRAAPGTRTVPHRHRRGIARARPCRGMPLAGLKMFFGSYPITPASPLLHHLARLKEFGITTFQAEDEIAAICAAIGASYAGKLGITSSSGPGNRAQDGKRWASRS